MWLGRCPPLSHLRHLWSFEAKQYEGLHDAIRYQKLDKLKSTRMSKLFSEIMVVYTKVSNICSGESVKLTTERTNWSFLSGQLSSVHMVLKLIATYLRVVRTFLSWKSVYTAVFTTNCVVLALVWISLPIGWLVHWCLRISVVVVHGPWFKLLDIWYFRPWYETKDELLKRIDDGRDGEDFKMPDFDSFLEDESFQQAARLARANTEELTKLRDMRCLLFGSYSEKIPYVDSSRYPSVPMPQSVAIQDDTWAPVDRGRGYHVPGQRLVGEMIHERPCQRDDSPEQ